MKKAFYLFFLFAMLSLSACDKHILKKLKKDKSSVAANSSNEASAGDATQLPVYPNGDFTGFPNKKDKVYMVASIKRTPCLGSCSIYEAKLYSDGNATFFGRKNVHMKGRYEGQIEQQQMKDLIDKINEVDFFSFEPNYPINEKKGVSEDSKTILTIQVGDQINKVKTNGKGPATLMAFENYLDELFDRMEWLPK